MMHFIRTSPSGHPHGPGEAHAVEAHLSESLGDALRATQVEAAHHAVLDFGAGPVHAGQLHPVAISVHDPAARGAQGKRRGPGIDGQEEQRS